MPSSLGMLRRPPITHNQGVQELDIFISSGIFGAARPSIILKALSLEVSEVQNGQEIPQSLSPSLLPIFYGAIRRLVPMGFFEAFMNFHGRHSLQKYLITAPVSSYSILQMCPLLKVFYLSNQA